MVHAVFNLLATLENRNKDRFDVALLQFKKNVTVKQSI